MPSISGTVLEEKDEAVSSVTEKLDSLLNGMDDFNSDTDSDYTSYWRDWVGVIISFSTLYSRSVPSLKRQWLKEGRCSTSLLHLSPH